MKLKTKIILTALLVLIAVVPLGISLLAEENDAPVVWQPADGAGITYAAFADEQAYLSGAEPIKVSTSEEITTKDIRELGAKYMMLYSNLTLGYGYGNGASVNYLLSNGANLTIDFNGKTVTMAEGFFLTDNVKCTLTMRNGTFTNPAQFQFRSGSVINLENMNLNVTDFGYASRGDFYAKDSKITITHSMYLSNYNAGGVNIAFENCDIIFNGTGYVDEPEKITGNTPYRMVPIYVIIYNGTKYGDFSLTIDANSSIQAPHYTKTPYLFAVSEAEDPEGNLANVSLNIADGIEFTSNLTPSPRYAYKAFGAAKFTGHTMNTDDAPANVDMRVMGDGLWYANIQSNGLCKLEKTPVSDGVAYYVFNKGTSVAIPYSATYIDGITEPVLQISELKKISEGATILFNTDLRTYSTDANEIFREFSKYLTIDLGGHTLFADHRWGTSNKEGENFTLKNGTVEVSISNYFIITSMGTAGGTVNVDNIHLIHKKSANGSIHLYGGVLNLTNSTFETSCPVVSFKEYGGACVLNTDNITVNTTSTLVSMRVNKNTHHTFAIKNSTVNASTVFDFVNTASGYESTIENYLTLDIQNSKFNSTVKNVSYASNIAAILTVNLDNTYSNMEFSVSAPHKIEYAQGQKLMAVDNATYKYAVTVPLLDMQMNLVLDSELLVNLYIPTDTFITTVESAGNLFKVDKITEKQTFIGRGEFYVLPLARLLPHVAAEDITVNVNFVKDEMEHTVALSFNITDYLANLLDTEYSYLLKELVAGTVNYIAAAYNKAGNENSALSALVEGPLYANNLPEMEKPVMDNTDMSALRNTVISSAQLDLGESYKVRFNLSESFTGTLNINGYDYMVENGKCAELTYVEFSLKAYEMYNVTYTLTAGELSGTYSLAAYSASVLEDEISEIDRALVLAFYNVCKCADRYVRAMGN